MLEIIKKLRRKGQGVDLTTPIKETKFVAIDVELTGLDEKKDSIVSIGAVKMIGGKIDLGASYYQLVKPEKALSSESVVIHEITPSEVEAKPPIEAAIADFLDFIGDDTLLGHFVAIDLAFLDRDVKRATGHGIRNPALDTYSMYEWLRGRTPDNKYFAERPARPLLYNLAKLFDVPVSGAHNAIMDAYTTALLFQRFIPILEAAGVSNIGELLKVGKPFSDADWFRISGEFSNF